MTVKSVYGRIQGTDAVKTAQVGDVWEFQVPAWATSPIIAEFWAEDEAGNTSYRSAVLEIEGGTIKCIRWCNTGCSCMMLAYDKPTSEMLTLRPTITMQEHLCALLEA